MMSNSLHNNWWLHYVFLPENEVNQAHTNIISKGGVTVNVSVCHSFLSTRAFHSESLYWQNKLNSMSIYISHRLWFWASDVAERSRESLRSNYVKHVFPKGEQWIHTWSANNYRENVGDCERTGVERISWSGHLSRKKRKSSFSSVRICLLRAYFGASGCWSTKSYKSTGPCNI